MYAMVAVFAAALVAWAARCYVIETGLLDDADGGWSRDNHANTIITPGSCTIDRRVACEACGTSWLDRVFGDCSRCLDEAEFRADYRGKQPVLIRGMLSGWAARHNWRSAEFLKRYGGTNLSVDEAVIVANQYRVGVPSLQLDEALPFLQENPNSFVFDPRQFLHTNKRLLRDFSTPSFFKDFSPKKGSPQSANEYGQMHNWHMFSLGANGSGLPWHTHGATWIGLVFGQKKWFVMAPGKATSEQRGSPLDSPTEWLRGTLPLLKSVDHLSCTQLPGEIMYLPAAWAHLTLNLGTG
jgi:hypothetical protein